MDRQPRVGWGWWDIVLWQAHCGGFSFLLKFWSTVWEEGPGAVTCSPGKDIEIPLVKDAEERAGGWETVSLYESSLKNLWQKWVKGCPKCG